MSKVDEMVRVLGAITKDFENGNDGTSFDISGECKKAAGMIEQLQAENEQLKADKPIQCKDCIHYIKLKNFDNECGITGGCVCDTDFCSNGERLEVIQ
jgi:hypothetical protein